MNQPRTIILFATLLILACTTSSSVAQLDDQIDWDVAAGNYNDFNNWDDQVVPQADQFLETASINNDGLAFVIDMPIAPFGLILGRTQSGTLEVRSGGDFSVVQVDGAGGQTVVGQNGLGNLTVLPGGMFETASLTSGGSADSAITIGGAGNGNASLSVLGNANLQRNTSLLGSNARLSAGSFSLGSEHQLNIQITDAGVTPISVANAVSLNGTLNIDFDGVMPTPGQTWDLFDAGEVRGDFSTFNASAGVGGGLGLVITQTPGGVNGTLAQLGIEAQLVLSVDRQTGAVAIENRAAGIDLVIDGYAVTSPEAVLVPDSWASIASQNAAWRETPPVPEFITETNFTGSTTLAGGDGFELGDIYSFTPEELGTPYPDLQFEYRLSDTGEIRTGLVEMNGPENDLVLVINPETGAGAIQNQSPFGLSIDGYGILSDAQSLNTGGWNSLQDSGDPAWRETPPTTTFLAETNISTSMELGAKGDPISLGTVFNTAAERDLAFEFRLDSGEIRRGTVVYGDPVDFLDTQTCGDFDQDGDVDSADRTRLTTGWTGALLPGQGSQTFEQGDCDGDGDVDSADQNGLITGWTGAKNAGNLTDGDDADLNYDPATGNVTLDATDTASGVLISLVIGTAENNMRTDNVMLPFVDVGTNSDVKPFQIGQTDPLNQGGGPLLNLGDILPTGLSLAGLENYLTLADYASELGVGGAFDLRVVPEPSSGLAGVFGVALCLCWRRSRSSKKK